ncbi:hypothetical protein AMJ44_03950 [candidate division WOR-1 bacterium DG_54_3]|uniref:Glucose-methanol-choline oxidoreductase N-terminal domain-containing protein n=1 Tax=candidate division WOR-1 bacterium DG_54_3 TaxID=1703775 RepID=A0A0S7Y3T2_UNCSA|nr:MAG: hypothetical protein AMJ44_03950 [candidate division WOR-1 bacterium DG_54_3]
MYTLKAERNYINSIPTQKTLAQAERVARNFLPSGKFDRSRFIEGMRLTLHNVSPEVRASIKLNLSLLQHQSLFDSLVKLKSPSLMYALFTGRVVIPPALDRSEIQDVTVERDFSPAVNLRNSGRLFEDFINKKIPKQVYEGVDLLVIGSGIGGISAAVAALRSNPYLKVVIIEDGEYHSPDQVKSYSQTEAMLRLYWGAGLTTMLDISLRGISGYPNPFGRTFGGGTRVNSRTAEIPREEVISRIMHLREFERIYRILEGDYHIEPVSLAAMGASSKLFMETSKQLGYDSRPLYGFGGGLCAGLGRCPSGCWLPVPNDPTKVHIPEILYKYNNTFAFTNTKAVVINRDPVNGKAKSVNVIHHSPDGMPLDYATFELSEKGKILLGGGIIGDFDLLHDSGYTPIDKNSGMTIHPCTEVSMLNLNEVVDTGLGRPQAMITYVPGLGVIETARPPMPIDSMGSLLWGENLKKYTTLFENRAIAGPMIDDGPNSRGSIRRIFGNTILRYHLAKEDDIRLKMLAVKGLQIWAATEGVEYLRAPVWPMFESEKELSEMGFFRKEELPDFEKYLLQPGVELLKFSFHPLGMAVGAIKKKADGSLIENHELPDMENVYVVDSSGIKGPLGINPQLLIAAKSYSIGEMLSESHLHR